MSMFTRKYPIRPILHSTPLFLLGLLFTVGATGIWLYLPATKQTGVTQDEILLFAAYGAIIGWVINTYLVSKTAQKQHTINVLLNHTSNHIYHEYSKTFMEKYPPHDESAVLMADIENDHTMREAVRYLLNEYEFIAAALKRHDLDYDLMKDTIRKQLCTLVRKCDTVIKDSRGEKPSGHTEHPKVYEHLLDLHKEWAQDDKR